MGSTVSCFTYDLTNQTTTPVYPPFNGVATDAIVAADPASLSFVDDDEIWSAKLDDQKQSESDTFDEADASNLSTAAKMQQFFMKHSSVKQQKLSKTG
jgi:hypothetical protein